MTTATPSPPPHRICGGYTLGVMSFNAGNWHAPEPGAVGIREDWVKGWVKTWHETMNNIEEAGDKHADRIMTQYLRMMYDTLGDEYKGLIIPMGWS